jgi:hypothetical protein
MAAARLDWSTAEVRDGKLTVSIAGDPPKGWNDAFNSTAALLGGRDVGHVELRKRAAHVDGVTPGSEERTRHLLESVVQQANSALADERDAAEQDSEPGNGDESPDTEMTKRFRSFAAEHEQEQSEDEQKK